jgi:hypothetical protein
VDQRLIGDGILLCFGLGYSTQHYLASYGGRFERVWAIVRDAVRIPPIADARGGPQLGAPASLCVEGAVAFTAD